MADFISIEHRFQNSVEFIQKFQPTMRKSVKASFGETGKKARPYASRAATKYFNAPPRTLSRKIDIIRRLKGGIESYETGVKLQRRGINLKNFLTRRARVPMPTMKGRSPGRGFNSSLPKRSPEIEVEIVKGRRVKLRRAFTQKASRKNTGKKSKIAVFMTKPGKPKQWIPLAVKSLATLINNRRFVDEQLSFMSKTQQKEFVRLMKVFQEKEAARSRV